MKMKVFLKKSAVKSSVFGYDKMTELGNIISMSFYHFWGRTMEGKKEKIEILKELIKTKKIFLFSSISKYVNASTATLRRYIKALKGMSSYTHNGKFVTLPEIPQFDENGIWFYRNVGFSSFKNSMELIVNIINKSESGITKEGLDEILKIDVSKQINTLLHREQINRVKIGRKYHYISEALAKSKKKRIRLLRAADIEESFDANVTGMDLIALLKAVLMEQNIGIDSKSIRCITQKYSLKLPEKKIEYLLLKYDLTEKKSPDAAKRTEDKQS